MNMHESLSVGEYKDHSGRGALCISETEGKLRISIFSLKFPKVAHMDIKMLQLPSASEQFCKQDFFSTFQSPVGC